MSTKQVFDWFVRRGIIVSDTRYTAHGFQVRKYAPIYNNLLVPSNLVI
jgi:hypothetical protein